MNVIIIFISCIIFTPAYPLLTKIISLQENESDCIHLIINDIRTKSGVIRIGVFTAPDGYPDKPEFSYSLSKDTISSGRLRLVVPLKKTGQIGFSILDDENSNGRMDYILGIMPKEGFGFSNNPKIKSRKPPPFSETCINFQGGRKVVTVNMKYL